MNIRPKLEKLQKSRKRRLPINDTSALSELQQHEANPENEENSETNLIKFEQGSTQMGAVSLWYGGYRYVKNRNIWWKCSNKDCQAYAKAEEKDGQFLGTLGRNEHNHPPAIQKKTCEEIRNKLKKDNRPILGEVRANIPDEVYIALGSDNALQQLIRRQKKKKFGNVNCVDLGRMVIPAFLTQKYNSSTLIYDSRNERGNEDVVLVFSHARLLEILSQNKNWAIDGTFKCAPKPFLQCFCVGAFVRGRIVVCVQALLPSKKTIHYDEVLREVRRAINPNEPKRDFEKSEIAALQSIFPAAQLSGCLFHFGQSLWRKWRQFGLDYLLGDDTDEGERARTNFRRILALALIPPQHVRRGFGLILTSSPACMSTFIAYFAATYIGLSQIEKRLGAEAFQQGVLVHSIQENTLDDHSFHPIISTPIHMESIAPPTPSISLSTIVEIPRWEMPLVQSPQYPIVFWNVNDRAVKALAKTNNALESSHYHFVKKLNHHPSMSDFLLAILDDVDKQVDIARSATTFTQQRKRKYVIKEFQVMHTLNEAEYDDNRQLLNVLTLLGLQMSGYVEGLRVATRQQEERDTEDGVDSAALESQIISQDHLDTSSSLFIY